MICSTNHAQTISQTSIQQENQYKSRLLATGEKKKKTTTNFAVLQFESMEHKVPLSRPCLLPFWPPCNVLLFTICIVTSFKRPSAHSSTYSNTLPSFLEGCVVIRMDNFSFSKLHLVFSSLIHLNRFVCIHLKSIHLKSV